MVCRFDAVGNGGANEEGEKEEDSGGSVMEPIL